MNKISKTDITKITKESDSDITTVLEDFKTAEFYPSEHFKSEKEKLIEKYHLRNLLKGNINIDESYFQMYTLPIIQILQDGKKITTKIALTIQSVDGENFQQEYFAKCHRGNQEFEKIEDIRSGIDFINKIEEIIGDGCELTNITKSKIIENFDKLLKKLEAINTNKLNENVKKLIIKDKPTCQI